jgi:hypothetical protein
MLPDLSDCYWGWLPPGLELQQFLEPMLDRRLDCGRVQMQHIWTRTRRWFQPKPGRSPCGSFAPTEELMIARSVIRGLVRVYPSAGCKLPAVGDGPQPAQPPLRQRRDRWQTPPIAYYHVIGQFLDWYQRAGFGNLEDIEPIDVAAHTEHHPGTAATFKQHIAAIRMLFSWLTEIKTSWQ